MTRDEIRAALEWAQQFTNCARKALDAQNAVAWFQQYGAKAMEVHCGDVGFQMRLASKCSGADQAAGYIERQLEKMLPEAIAAASIQASSELALFAEMAAAASAIETRRAETQSGSVEDESAIANGETPNTDPENPHGN